MLMANPTLPRSPSRFPSPAMHGLAYGLVLSLILWAVIAAAVWIA
jgi:hypothetical protein